MDRIELNRILDQFEKNIATYPLAEETNPSVAIAFGENKDGKRVAGQTWIKDTNKRYAILENFGRQLSEDEFTAEAIMLISESWTSENLDIMPSEDPKRGEAVVFTIMNRQGDTILRMYNIEMKSGKKSLKKVDSFNDVKSPLLQVFWKGYYNI